MPSTSSDITESMKTMLMAELGRIQKDGIKKNMKTGSRSPTSSSSATHMYGI